MTPTPEYHQIEPYKTYNYALFHMKGLNYFLDILRYERGFLCRENDLNLILSSLGTEGDFILKPFTILLGKYDIRGITKPSWPPNRLISDTKMEEVRDHGTLFSLNIDGEPIFSVKKPLKFRAEGTLKASLRMILKIMFLNKACPADESIASKMERAYYEPDKEIEAVLTNFLPAKEGWRFPKEFIL